MQEWIDSHPNWNDGMRRGRASAVQRAFNWAVRQGYIDRSPLVHMEKPAGGKRENVIEFELYQEFGSAIDNEYFATLITVAWEIGCRPQEILRVEARHVDVEGKRWVFPREESKGKKRSRIVYLNEVAFAIVQRLMTEHPQGKLFCNSDGKPWTPWAVNSAFCRLQIAMGRRAMAAKGIQIPDDELQKVAESLKPMKTVKGKRVKKDALELRREARKKIRRRMACNHANKYALVDFRHSFCQRALKAGVDPVTLAYLIGHVDTSMLARVYSHLSQDPTYLRGMLDRINGSNREDDVT